VFEVFRTNNERVREVLMSAVPELAGR